LRRTDSPPLTQEASITATTTEATSPPDRRTFGTLRLRGAIWWVRYKVDGKTYEESSGSRDRRKAEKRLATREAELGRGIFVAPNLKNTTVVELADMLRDDYRINGRRSLQRVETSLHHLLDFFDGPARVTTVTSDRIAAYVRARQEAKAAAATIHNELAALKRMFTLGLRAGKVSQRPHIPALQVSNARQGFFEEGDFRALLRELPGALKPVVEFAYLTGWRIPSEVLRLTWAQINFKAGIVRLEPRTTKNDEGRAFPFDALPALKRLLEKQRNRTKALERATGRIIPHVFHRDGEAIRYFRRAWLSAIDRAACKERGAIREVVRPELLGRIPHDLRRTAVRNLVRAGVPERVAMQLTGHKTRSVFDRYNIVNERDLRDGVARLAGLHQRQANG